MIRSHSALMRMAQDFFARELAGRYAFDNNVKLRDPELVPDKQRREERQGRYRECVWLSFGPWEIGIFSSQEKPPLGELILRGNEIGAADVVSGPLDPATWSKIASEIKTHQPRITHHGHW
jgi:hypothetical protein